MNNNVIFISNNDSELYNTLIKELKEKGIRDKYQVKLMNTFGLKTYSSIIFIYPDNIRYINIKKDDISKIINSHLIEGKIIDSLLYKNESKKNIKLASLPIYHKQLRIVLRNAGTVDPENIETYIERHGYRALLKILSIMSPDDVLMEIKKSGLRGRGGAGYPTWMKWNFSKITKNETKYIICNADEGDPGAYMDRSVLESDPHSVIEGMIIAAYTINANIGYIYIRAEYPLAIKRLEKAIKDAHQYGFLGEKILGTDFSFNIELRLGAGAFVCGEETALIASIEGKRGTPKPRPPFPSTNGLWNKPTVINNVETLANIPLIILKGGDWYNKIGTEKSTGTKVFAVTGKINKSGLVEVPMGITVKEIVYDIGSGSPTGKIIKAVHTGGPSGGCIPQELFNLPIDYKSLKQAGTIMGSGGMLVLDEDTCMVDFARYFMNFLQEESCGKCSTCREGTQRMHEILTDITEGKANVEGLELLEELGNVIKDASLCGLGQTAPNSVLSTLRYFRNEYLEHIVDHYCRAGVCRKLSKSPCENRCPVHLNIPGYIQLLKENRLEEAYELIMLDNPLPATTGRICGAPCNSRCKRTLIDEAINTKSLHRYVSDTISP